MRLVSPSLGFAALLVLAPLGAQAANDVDLPGDKAFPESITSTADGTLYVSNLDNGGVVKVPPGGKAEEWIKPGAFGTRSTLGVFADEANSVLWVCSNDLTAFGVPGPSTVEGAYLKAFDLKTGEGRISARLPGSRALCNDMETAPDGSLLVTNSWAPEILQLKKGGDKLEVWKQDDKFAPPEKGAGLDGIHFGSDGNLYVNLFTDGKLFRVAVKDGKPGDVTELKPSQPIKLSDAIRADKSNDTFLMIDGTGKLYRVTPKDDAATIETLKDGIDGPTGVTRVGDTAYVTVGQLPALFGKKAPTLPFKVIAVPLSGH